MKTICAWCGVFLHGENEAATVSHGLCPACEAKMHAEMDQNTIPKKDINPAKHVVIEKAFLAELIASREALSEVVQRAEDLADVVRNGGNYRRAVEWFDEAIKEYRAISLAKGAR
jgi:hypothetical protein